ncbi:MAG: type II toxin-antitoxin system VapC family toxin, partial [Chloroflexota bacterium]
IDTNVLVRFFTQDDPDQYQKSVQIFANEDIFIPDTVVLETEWVLRFAYHFGAKQINDAFRKLFGLPNVNSRDTDTLALALSWHEAGLDFADALQWAQAAHCEQLLTFDQRFVKRAEPLQSCPVKMVE